MTFLPSSAAFSRHPLSVEPHTHWLRVPPTTIVPLLASERQSGWVAEPLNLAIRHQELPV
jgi:hypothetical protein